MEQIKLEVQTRGEFGTRKIKKVRREDFVPGIIYGDGKDALPVKVNRKAYERIMRLYKGQNVIFHLDVVDGKKKVSDYSAIVREEQQDPVNDQILHIDFNRISLTKEIEVKVAVVTKGEPVGVKQDGGSLEHVLWELDVICLPTKIPAKIEVEVGHLKIGDAIHVREIVLPEGVKTKHDPDAVLVTVAAPMKEEIATPAEGAITEPEVLKEKKDKAPEAGASEGKAEEKDKEKTEKKAEKK